MRIKFMAAAVVALALIGGGLWVRAVVADRDRLAGEAARLAREAAGLRYELSAGYAALAVREKQSQRLAAETAELKRRLEVAYQNDTETRAWVDAPCPDAVLQCLRR